MSRKQAGSVRTLSLIAAVLLFPLGHVLAGSLDAEVGATISGVVGNPTANPACSGVHSDGSALTISNCSVFNMTNPFNSNPESLTISGFATASYGSLGSSNSVSLVNADLSAGGVASSGYARVIDNLVSSLPGNDMISLVFNLDGSSATPVGLNFSNVALSFGFDYGTFRVPYSYQFKTTNFNGQIVTPAYPAYFFQNYTYFFSLASMDIVSNQTSTSYNASGSVDFSHTAAITGVGVWDSNGVLQSGATVGDTGTGGNLTVMNVTEVNGVPEPATYLATGAALLGLAVLRRARRRPIA